jgi:hypothetical protein
MAVSSTADERNVDARADFLEIGHLNNRDGRDVTVLKLG